MECAPQACTSRFLWSCYLAQSYGDEEVAQADMWVPINLAKASSLHTSPNVMSTPMSLGRVGGQLTPRLVYRNPEGRGRKRKESQP